MRQLLSTACLWVLCAATAAANSLCPPQPDGNWLTLASGRAQYVDAHGFGDAVSIAESRVGFQAQTQPEVSWSLFHHYRSFNVEQTAVPPLDSNGHVHQIALPLRWEGDNWRFAGAPALAVSSNALRHPQHLDGNSWQLWAAAVYSHSGWQLGLCADSRFDRYRVYPTAGFEWESEVHWHLRLVYPDPLLRYRISGHWTVELFTQPYGGDWQVFDNTLQQSSRWRYRAWRDGLRLGWQSGDWRLNLALGEENGRTIRARRQDGSRTRLQVDTGTYALMEVQWRWRQL